MNWLRRIFRRKAKLKPLTWIRLESELAALEFETTLRCAEFILAQQRDPTQEERFKIRQAVGEALIDRREADGYERHPS